MSIGVCFTYELTITMHGRSFVINSSILASGSQHTGVASELLYM